MPSQTAVVTREWDAATYDRVALPHHDWATVVLDRLELTGDEVVLDAGCGSGTVTGQLLPRLPAGRIVALDGSARMLEEARRRLADHLDRVSFVHGDLRRSLLVEPVDAVVSSATFHWIADHRALFANLAAVMRPGGRLSAQCGGAGNGGPLRQAIHEIRPDLPDPWHFATAQEAQTDLTDAGFVDVHTWLTPAPAPIPAGEVEAYLATVVLGAHLEHLPEAEHDAFVRAVAERLPGPEIDYVRLNLVAHLP
jgi:trans-aconitate 2-methyltransferase